MNQIYKYVISNKIVASISIIIAAVGIIGIITELIDKQFSFDTYYLIGILMILLVFLRTIISDFHMVFTQQNNTFCDTGQYGTKYDLEHFITKKTNDLYIIGQNLRTIISETKNIEAIKKYLNKKNKYLTLILSPYDVLQKVHPLAAADLLLSINELKNLKNSFDDDIKKRFNIWFHYGTVTLSSMIKNPKDTNSVLIFRDCLNFNF